MDNIGILQLQSSLGEFPVGPIVDDGVDGCNGNTFGTTEFVTGTLDGTELVLGKVVVVSILFPVADDIQGCLSAPAVETEAWDCFTSCTTLCNSSLVDWMSWACKLCVFIIVWRVGMKPLTRHSAEQFVPVAAGAVDVVLTAVVTDSEAAVALTTGMVVLLGSTPLPLSDEGVVVVNVVLSCLQFQAGWVVLVAHPVAQVCNNVTYLVLCLSDLTISGLRNCSWIMDFFST